MRESSDSTEGGESHGCSKKKSISLKEKFEIILKIQSGMKQTHISEQLSVPNKKYSEDNLEE